MHSPHVKQMLSNLPTPNRVISPRLKMFGNSCASGQSTVTMVSVKERILNNEIEQEEGILLTINCLVKGSILTYKNKFDLMMLL